MLTGRQTAGSGSSRPAACRATRAGRRASTTTSRTATPPRRCPGPTASRAAYALTGQQPPRRRGDRRRRAHRRHGLGGAEQHRRGDATATSSSWSTTTAAPTRRRSAALADQLAALRLQPGYERVLETGKQRCDSTPVVGAPALRGAARAQGGDEGRARARRSCSPTSASSTSARSTATTSPPMESALRRARDFGGPVIVHAVTRKGRGLPARGERRGRADAQPGRRSTRRPGCRPGRRASAGPACSPRRWSALGARAARTSSRSRRRCSAPPGWRRSPRRSPSAASTSASPSSTR